jgi:AAA domain
MGMWIANGSIHESIVRETLYYAMIVNGYVAKRGEQATLATLNSGLNAGKAHPRPRLTQNDPARLAVDPNAFRMRDPAPANVKRFVRLLRGDSIDAKAVHWLWTGFVPSGKLTILAGAGGTGKSTLAFGLAAIVTTAGVWPDGTRCVAPGNVLIWSSEDDPADTIAPRIMAAGANASRYGVIEGTRNERGDNAPFDPANDMEALREAVKRIGGISLLIIDPIVSAVMPTSHLQSEAMADLGQWS